MGLLDILNEVMRAKGPRQQNTPEGYGSLLSQFNTHANALNEAGAQQLQKQGLLGLNASDAFRKIADPAAVVNSDVANAAMGFAPIGMAGTFAGIGAKTADVAALGKAQAMTKAGADPVEVWKATGWTDQFPDKKWRFEIPDNAATIKGDPLPTTPINGRNYESWNVGAVTQHDPLFAAYPQLKSIEQSFQTTGGGTYHVGGGGWISLGDEYKQGLLGQAQKAAIAEATAKVDKFSRSPRVNRYNETLDGLFDQEFKPKVSEDEFNAIHKKLGGPRIDRVRNKLLKEERDIRQAAANNPTGGNALAPEAKSVQFHELQHAVQGEENFARGGNVKQFNPEAAKHARDVLAWRNEIDAYISRKWPNVKKPDYEQRLNATNELRDEYRRLGAPDWLPSQKAMDDAVSVNLNPGESKRQKFEQIVSEYGLDRRTTPFDAMTMYKRLAGEAEARLTQSRIPLTAAERRARPPWQEFDVPPEQQIVRGLLGQ